MTPSSHDVPPKAGPSLDGRGRKTMIPREPKRRGREVRQDVIDARPWAGGARKAAPSAEMSSEGQTRAVLSSLPSPARPA